MDVHIGTAEEVVASLRRPTPRWSGRPTSPCRSIRSTRRIPSSCARSSWWPRRWRRPWAGDRATTRRPARRLTREETSDGCDRQAGRDRARLAAGRDSGRPSAGAQACTGEPTESLFKPASEADASRAERLAIACFVRGLHGQPGVEALLSGRAGRFGCARRAGAAPLPARSRPARARGRSATIPQGPLSGEDMPGAALALDGSLKAALGPRLAAALRTQPHAGLPPARRRARVAAVADRRPAGRPPASW